MWRLPEEERQALEATWLAFAIKRGDVEPVSAWWYVIEVRHSEPHRHYHSLGHVRDMLHLVNGEVAVAATFFHDIVYDPTRNDNEDASAKLAAMGMREIGFSVSTIDLVGQMIRATTTHDGLGLPSQCHHFLDADLAILGASRDRYVEYRDAIRREYAFLSDGEFTERRRGLLDALLSRPRIFLTQSMHDQFEEQARANLQWELSGPEPSVHV